jgi:hypothetical protein
MAPGEKLSGQLLGDGMAFDETGEQALAEQLITASASHVSRG